MNLSRDINIYQKTDWFMLRKLHEVYISNETPPEFLDGGIFHIDEAFIGNFEYNPTSSA